MNGKSQQSMFSCLIGFIFCSCLPNVDYFDANPQTIESNDTSTLTWQVSNAGSVIIDQNIGLVPSSGSEIVQPMLTTIYTLTARNSFGSTDEQCQVSVNAYSFLVTSEASKSSGETPLQIDFSGSASGGIAPYSWAWDLDGDGDYDDSSIQNPSYTYNAAGTFDVRLKATDDLGNVAYSTAIVIEVNYSQLLVSSSSDVISGTKPLAVIFSGSASGGALPYSWAWDLDGDGEYDDSSLQNPSYTYNVAGNFNVKLRVTDNAGSYEYSSNIEIEIFNPSYSIADAWWVQKVDNDADGARSSGQLAFDIDVNDGEHAIYAEIWYGVFPSGSYSLYRRSSIFQIDGISNTDYRVENIGYPNTELNGPSNYNFRIDIYESGTTTPIQASYGNTNDDDLNAELFELYGDD